MRDAPLPGVAVGFFDGVHLGHRAILARAHTAITFRQHPLALLAPDRAPRLIMTCEERLAAIRACGVREVIALDFTDDLANMSADEFAATHLKPRLNGGPVLCGTNGRFGKGGEGTADALRARGYAVEVVPFAVYGGERVSSSRIRATLERGEIAEATAMLSRPFGVEGRVVSGKGLGLKIGFPTINLQPENLNLRLPRGVYAVTLDGVRGVANYGVAPTCGKEAWTTPVLEIHLLTPPTATTRAHIRVIFERFIRPERTFHTIDALQRQIAADCAAAVT